MPKRPTATTFAGATAVCLIALGLVLLAHYRMRTSPHAFDWRAIRAGIAAVQADTVPAALRTWALLGVTLAALARWLRRRSHGFSPGEAAAGALILLWTACYLALLSLGPASLHRPMVLRGGCAALVLAAFLTARGSAAPWRPRPGRPVAVLAFAVIALPMLALQLSAPVSPFMDVLPYVASVQKIVTFQHYDAFANDAAGQWAPTRQVGGSDAFFSAIALVTGVPAALGITSTMVVLGGFQLLAIYLLGRTYAGSLAGAFSAWFLLQTFVWRRTADARGTAVAFILVSAGLALFLQGLRRRHRGKAALGAAGLGISVTVNPLIGALGLVVAGVTAVLEMVDRRRGLVLVMLVLGGATVLALPQVAIGSSRVLPLAALPALAAAGALILWLTARGPAAMTPPAAPRSRLARLLPVVALPVIALFLHARRLSDFFTDDWHEYGRLTMFGGLGIIAGAALAWRNPRRAPALVPAVALLVGVAAHAIGDPLRFNGGLEVRSLASEVTTKMTYYWAPYWLALGAGLLFAVLARRLGRGTAVVMVMLVTIYPLRQVKEYLDFDASELSVAESMAFHFGNTARGYFGGYPDRRRVGDQHWDVIDRAFRAEIRAGRLDYYTHVLHITQSTGVEAALVTGVSVDLVTPRYDPNSIWTVGGRSRGMGDVPGLLAARPPYVLLEEFPPERFDNLPGYESIATAPRLWLYRRVGPAAPPVS